jgi:hypothetical protein
MKKLILILLMTISHHSYAVDIELNNVIVNEELAKKVINYIFDDVLENEHATIHTGTAIQKGKFSKCWNKVVYNGQGIPRMRLVCY